MLNYTPDASARALRNAKTHLLGFALHHVNSPIYTEMFEIAQVEATRKGYSIVLMNTAELAQQGDLWRLMVHGHRVDGLLIQGGFGDSDRSLRTVAHSIPSVMFGSGPVEGLRTITLQDISASKIATQHLIDLGHSAIAFVGADGTSSARRYDGYLAALAEHGLPALPAITGGWTADSAHEATLRLLTSEPRVTGIVSVATTTALGVNSGIVAAGRHVPDDISLIGIHDAPFARHLNPPLTTVSLPISRVGSIGVSLLIDQISNPTSGDFEITDPVPRLVIRSSTQRL